MQEHFGFTDEQMKKLEKRNIGTKELYKFANKFDPTGNKAPMSMINLLYYVDKKGDFTEKPIFRDKLICSLIMQNLDKKQQFIVYQYIEDFNDGKF